MVTRIEIRSILCNCYRAIHLILSQFFFFFYFFYFLLLLIFYIEWLSATLNLNHLYQLHQVQYLRYCTYSQSMVTKPLSNCFQLYLANLLLVSKLCRMLKNKNQRHWSHLSIDSHWAQIIALYALLKSNDKKYYQLNYTLQVKFIQSVHQAHIMNTC